MINDNPYIHPIKLPHIGLLLMLMAILLWPFVGGDASQLGNSGNYYRIVLVGVSGVISLITVFSIPQTAVRLISLSLWMFVIYGFVAVLSTFLVPQAAFYALWKASEVIIATFLVMGVLSSSYPEESMLRAYHIVIMFLSVLLISTWVGVILFPGEALLPSRGVIPYTIQGVVPVLNGNSVAFYAAIVALDSICAVLEKQPSRLPLLFRWGWILAVLITLVVAQSRTSLVGLILALLIYLFITRRLGLLLLLVLISVIGLFGLGAYQGFESYFLRGQSTELFTSLSGRTGGWAAAWEMFKQSPWVGHGFAAAARLDILGVGGASTLHGSIFDVIVGVGLIGLIPWAIALLYGSVSGMRAPYLTGLNETQRRMSARLFCIVVLILCVALLVLGLLCMNML